MPQSPTDGQPSGDPQLETVAGITSAADPRPIEPSRGDAIGRYVVLDRIGRGGMGVVYSAYDPELDRKVAIKLVRLPAAAEVGATDSREDRLRLMREAQAMARLAHPNIVTVHDVGVVADRVYVAMELVDGSTLTRWSKDRAPSRREIVDVFLQAGRGLAAAHAAGIVHRDFKPDNVIVGTDGRVRVLDFGLARAESGRAKKLRTNAVLDVELTTAGSVMGTPAYMAPEQHLGLVTDARSDQFAYCVALFEALCGERPFRADSLAALAVCITEGRIDPAVAARMPAWLHGLVVRGLAADPAERHASMAALLVQLARDPAARRRRVGLVVGAVVLVAAVPAATAWRERVRTLACERDAAEVDAVWDESAKHTSREAFAATGVAHAGDTWRHVDAGLTAWATTWRDARFAACELGADATELRRTCLDDRLVDARALVATFADADRESVNQFAEAAASLAAVDRCSDDAWLAARTPPPGDTATREGIAAVRERLAQAKALARAGRNARALELGTTLVADARALEHAPLVAEALLFLGGAQIDAVDYPAARASLEDAYYTAGAASDDDVATTAAAELVELTSQHLVEKAAAEGWARAADMELARSGRRDELLAATVLATKGELADTFGRPAEALALLEEALEIRERLLGADHPAVSRALAEIAVVLRKVGRLAEALAGLERATTIAESSLGAGHPQLAGLLFRSAQVLADLGRLEEALVRDERALEIVKLALGASHPQTAKLTGTVGRLLLELGRADEALARMQEATAILEDTLGPEHPDVAIGVSTLGIAYVRTKQPELALANFRRAGNLFEKAFGPEHPAVASAQAQIGEALADLGRHREALPHFERSLTISEAAYGPDHANVVITLMSIGRGLLDLAEPRKALVSLERATASCARIEIDPAICAESHQLLGRARLATGDRDGALDHGRRARALYSGTSAEAVRVAEIDAWLREIDGSAAAAERDPG